MKLKTKITGSKVHEVGYRVLLLRKALEVGVERFNAYNTKENGNQVLIAFLEGDEDQIHVFREFASSYKPENAEVSDRAFEDYEGYVISIVDFMHLFTAEQLSKGIPAILSIDRKQDKMLEKQDMMLEKQDRMLDKLDETRTEIVREIKESKTEIVGEIRELRWDLKSYLDEKLMRIESDVAQIKAKIGI